VTDKREIGAILMKYSLAIVCSMFVGFVFSSSDMPVVSFDNPFLSSPYTHALNYTMRVWSDIRMAAAMAQAAPHGDDYSSFVYAIIGQLFCLNTSISACDTTLVLDDITYLGRVLDITKQEASMLPLIPAQADAIRELFKSIEIKISALLDNAQ
jgi:hypothetical protein